MYIIIAGGGMIGKGLTRRLVEAKHDVVVIDLKHEICEEIYAKYGAVTIVGNATDLDTLESAKMDKCDVAVAVLRSDPDNLAFALLAKHFKVPQILVRMINSKYENVYKSAGVHNIARTTELLIDQLLVNIESPQLRKVITLGSVEICIINVPENGKIIGKTIDELKKMHGFPDEISFVCLYAEEQRDFVIAHPQTKLKSNDRLFICGRKKEILQAAAIIKAEKRRN